MWPPSSTHSYPDEALDILTHTADGGLTSLRANPLKGTPEALCEKLLASGAKTAAPGLVPGSVLARFEGSPAESGLFREGYFHVEGQASQLAALCVEAKPGDTVLDLCAAPGGKSLLLIEEMEDEGRLVSCDVSENRVQLIRKAVERMGFAHVEPRVSDGTKTGRRPAHGRPHPWWTPRAAASASLPRSRTSATRPSKKRVTMNYWPPSRPFWIQPPPTCKPGGRLVYSTCTIDPCRERRAGEGLRGPTPGVPGGDAGRPPSRPG